MSEVTARDNVKGRWDVHPASQGTVWCDASSLAVGVCLEIERNVDEDASCLRKPDDTSHTHQLEAILRGVNLALRWDLRELIIMIESVTVHGWVSSILTFERRIKTHGLGEALVRRRLTLLKDIIDEYALKAEIRFVRSQDNKADGLTRVPKRWLNWKNTAALASISINIPSERLALIRNTHAQHHLGADRIHYIIGRCYPEENITKQEVEQVVRNCRECLSIDPSPVRWESGSLEVETVWYRLACDVTHYGGKKFFTMIDCGPSRFAMWRMVADESWQQITRVLMEVFTERGPPIEILLDNSSTFRSEQVGQLCRKWGVTLLFRAVNRASGNGIVERNHRTIKRMAARTGGAVQEMVFWYNFAAREGSKSDTAPCSSIFKYTWRCPGETASGRIQGFHDDSSEFKIGEGVFEKPNKARCTTRWRQGTVTAVLSPVTVEIDGLPYHVADDRREGDHSVEPQPEIVSEELQAGRRDRPQRQIRLPKRFADYVVDDEDIMGVCS